METKPDRCAWLEISHAQSQRRSVVTLYLKPLSFLSSWAGIKAPILAPVNRYNWRASRMIALSNPGMNRRWSACHIDDIIRRKSFLVKLWSGSSTFSIHLSFPANVLLIHCVAVSFACTVRFNNSLRYISRSGLPSQFWFAILLQTHQIAFQHSWGPMSSLAVHFCFSCLAQNDCTSE